MEKILGQESSEKDKQRIDEITNAAIDYWQKPYKERKANPEIKKIQGNLLRKYPQYLEEITAIFSLHPYLRDVIVYNEGARRENQDLSDQEKINFSE